MIHTLLLVEDEDDLRDSMRDLLEGNGYAVIAARDGREALDALDRADALFCLVLLDLLMPRMNGWDFFDAMRTRPQFASIPVVVHSSSPSRAPAGVRRVLQKPLQPERLLAAVREYCPQ